MTAENSSKGTKKARNRLDVTRAVIRDNFRKQSIDLEESNHNKPKGPKNISMTRNLGFGRNLDPNADSRDKLESLDLHGEDALRIHDVELDDLHGEDALRTHDTDLHGLHGDENFEFSDSESPALYRDDILNPHGFESLGPLGEDRFKPHGSEDANLSNLKRKRRPSFQR